MSVCCVVLGFLGICNLLGVLQKVYICKMWRLVVFVVFVVFVVLVEVLCRVSKEFVRSI